MNDKKTIISVVISTCTYPFHHHAGVSPYIWSIVNLRMLHWAQTHTYTHITPDPPPPHQHTYRQLARLTGQMTHSHLGRLNLHHRAARQPEFSPTVLLAKLTSERSERRLSDILVRRGGGGGEGRLPSNVYSIAWAHRVNSIRYKHTKVGNRKKIDSLSKSQC